MDKFKNAREEVQDLQNELDRLEGQRKVFIDKADSLLKMSERQDRDLSEIEDREFAGHIAEADKIALRMQTISAELREKTDYALGLKHDFSGGNNKYRMGQNFEIADVVGGVHFDRQGRAIGTVHDNAFSSKERKMSVNVRPVQLSAFANNEQGRRAAHDCAVWLKAVLASSKGIHDDDAITYARNRFGNQIFATHTEGSNSAGGYLVPTELSQIFVEYQKQVGIARNICDVRTMVSDVQQVPKLVSGNSVTYPSEAASITPNDQTWGQLQLTAVKRAVLTKVSNELAMDAVISVIDQLVSRLGYEFAKTMDAELVSGDGTASFGGEQGLLDALGAAGKYYAGGGSTSGKDTWPELVMADFTNTMAKLPSEYRQNVSWLMSRSFYHGVCLQLAAAAGGSNISNLIDGMGNASPAWLGYPCYFTDELPTATATDSVVALFGSFRDAVLLGDRMPLQISFSDQRFFDEDVLAVRAVSRYDINVHEPGDGSSAGAYVALSTSAS